ncbi:MAG: hypothetical protein WCJ64_11215 [Rhodospirillaceae bacterium]
MTNPPKKSELPENPLPKGIPNGYAVFRKIPPKKPLEAAIEVIPNKLWIYKQAASRNWHARCRFDGEAKSKTFTTKTPNRIAAQEFAMVGYFELRGQIKAGAVIFATSFEKVANRFIEYVTLQHSQKQLSDSMFKIYATFTRTKLIPFFGEYNIGDVDDNLWNKFAMMNAKKSQGTMAQVRLTMVQLFKFAKKEKLFTKSLPEFKMIKKTKDEIRASFSPAEWAKVEDYLCTISKKTGTTKFSQYSAE